jgi:predicted ribosome quality control (RQC) complex YloA/Tae2 family protein
VLSLEELRRALPLLEARLRGHRVQAASQPDAETLVLSTWGHADGEGVKQHLVLSCREGCARVGLAKRVPAKLPTPPGFTQYLRAHALNAEIGGFRLLGDDRQLAIRLRGREGDADLLLAIFGRKSNIALLEPAGTIVAAMRSLRDTRPELSVGGVWTSPESRPPTRGSDRFEAVPDERFLCAIEEHYAGEVEAGEQGKLRHALERSLRKEHKTLARKLEKIERSLADAEKAVGLERSGELLKAVLSQVRKGDREVTARDFDTGDPVVIPLDPKLTPAENLARMFKRYQKAVRGLTKAGAQHEEVKAALDAVGELEEELAAIADDATAVEALAARPSFEKLLKKYEPRVVAAKGQGAPTEVKLGKRMVPLRLAPRRYATDGGLEIWVGRNDAGNDFLSTRLASGNDLFFHLDGAPGSHVILRTGGKPDPPSEAVLDACELAVHFSKAKNATRADVHVVPIKNVKKPKGAKAGLVMVHGGKTIHLRRMKGRLDRILDARVDD